MPLKSRTKRPVGRQLPTAPRAGRSVGTAARLALPHDRDESTHVTAATPDLVIVQAQRDLDAGLVDTDLRATPGLDADRHLPTPSPGRPGPQS